MLRFLFATAVAALSPVPAFTQSTVIADPYAASRAIIGDIGRIVTPDGVQDDFAVTLGGARQAVNVRGADRANPILIFVHGGPGAVEMPVAWSFQRPWEDFFTVVQWDQRGAGKSYPLNDPAAIAPTMTLERYRDDAIELIDVLRARYGKRKVLLLGHSWGSAVGLAVAAKRPDLLHAYIGMGQVIDFRENERVGFAWTLQQARARQDAEAIAALQVLAPYPRPEPLEIAKSDGWRKYAVRYGALAAGRDNADFYFHAPRLSPDYTPADRKAWSDGSAFSVATLWPRLDKVSFARLDRLKTPVILLLGRHDYTVPAPIADAWMKQLRAPAKTTVWFEHSAHLMMVEEPGRTLKALLDHALPTVRD
ncbi:alpha/beta hydrolase [Sphingomonas sp. SUN019]|uniref:alpha/beta fold hydrolase n=1 Tax=Sphingomonas sp. SUN019 TaxID=2937788 RepID=UPI002164B4FD|nr:alpha/beta hydrolase [Sphingomonas sp. SUN019]UVO50867.1 alpha/beta hydrolase [Sphingomonas sp. SUN019]